jgi:hypothetical protein
MQAPLFGRIDNWEVFAVMILYELFKAKGSVDSIWFLHSGKNWL